MQEINKLLITTDHISTPASKAKDIEVDVLRLDKIHQYVSGNKWFKLHYYLEDAKINGKKHILTYGGAWSNHILATAASCQMYGFDCTGIIRGEEPKVYSPILTEARSLRMCLRFMERTDFANSKFPDDIGSGFDYYIIPQGGYGIKGMQGASEILDLVSKEKYAHIVCAVGTGTMLAGLTTASLPSQNVTGISVLKNNFQLEDDVRKLLIEQKTNFSILHDYHFGGYAKKTCSLIEFMNHWFLSTGIPTDIVYTGKLFFAVNMLLQTDFFNRGDRILIIHSGGLHGNLSLPKGTLIF